MSKRKIWEPQNNYKTNEEFLEDQIKDNEKETASVDISFSSSNDNLNITDKFAITTTWTVLWNLYRKKITKKKKLFSKTESSNDIDKEKLFLTRTIRDNMEKRREERDCTQKQVFH